MPDPNRLITLITYVNAHQVEAAAFYLEQEGIRAFVADAATIRADWFLGPALGFVKVQVPESQAMDGLEVLKKYPRLMGAQVEVDEAAKCLDCGAAMSEEDEKCAQCGWTFGVVEEPEEIE